MENTKEITVRDMVEIAYHEYNGDREQKELVAEGMVNSAYFKLHEDEISARRNRDLKVGELMFNLDAMLHAADDLLEELDPDEASKKKFRRFSALFGQAMKTFKKIEKEMEGK